jgi:Mn2+/Fe2+ NRAMP family transporter
MGVLSKIVWFLPFIALYFADKVKKHEDQKLGNKLIIFAIVVFVILIAINALSFFSMF